MLNSRQMDLLGQADAGLIKRLGSKHTNSTGVLAGSSMRGSLTPTSAGSLFGSLSSLSQRSASKEVSPAEERPKIVSRPAARRVNSQSSLQRRRVTIDTAQADRLNASSSNSLLGPKELLTPLVPIEVADKAAILARKHRLELHEVKHILNQFCSAELVAGHISLGEFGRILRNIFHAKDMDPLVVKSAYRASSRELGHVDMDMFLLWYVQNMFTAVNSLNADKSRDESDSLVYSLSKEFNVDAVTIDTIKRSFDKFDVDGSQEIDLDEFKEMLKSMLRAANIGDLSEERVMGWWREIDKDGSGGVDFSEYCEWYLKYFNSDQQDGGKSPALVQAFYNSFNPTLQRAAILERAQSKQISGDSD